MANELLKSLSVNPLKKLNFAVISKFISETALLLTGRRHDGDRRFIKWTRFLVKASWLNIRRKCCKACGTGTQERYCLIQDACAC